VFASIKLSGKPVTEKYNLLALLFFGSLMIIGYISVFVTLYEIIKGIPYIGDRPDLHPLA
jgi:hypothetical protein